MPEILYSFHEIPKAEKNLQAFYKMTTKFQVFREIPNANQEALYEMTEK